MDGGTTSGTGTLPGDAASPGTTPAGVPGTANPPPPSDAGRQRAAEQALLDETFVGSLPPALIVVGLTYAILSGAMFLTLPEQFAVAGWAATATLGLTLAATGLLVRRRAVRAPPSRDAAAAPLGVPVLYVLALLAALLLAAHSLVFTWISQDPSQTAYLLTLLAVGGYFFLRPVPLAAFMAFTVAGWLVLVNAMSVTYEEGGLRFVVPGIVAGALAHAVRVRSLRTLARTRAEAAHRLRAGEERFRSLAEAAREAILLVDDSGRVTYLNPAGRALFGYTDREATSLLLSQLLAEGGDVASLVGVNERTGVRRDGTRFPAELSLARTTLEGRTAHTGILRDMTERLRAAAATQAATAHAAEVENLRQMNEFKTRFLNTAAHELNTPLTPLRLQLHLLRRGQMGPLSERQQKSVDLLDRNVTRISGLVAEILDVARLQGGGLRLTVRAVSVDDVVDEVLGSFEEAARRVGVSLSFAGDGNLAVAADRDRLVQVLVNLVSNALKFTPSGGRVTVAARAEGGWTTVSVTDTGLGLTPEQQEHLFQPFSQVHDPMAVTKTGTGLGLFICKGLIEAHGGTVGCSSPGPGRGSTFHFTLPSSTGPVPPPPPASPTPIVTGPEDAVARRLRELI